MLLDILVTAFFWKWLSAWVFADAQCKSANIKSPQTRYAQSVRTIASVPMQIALGGCVDLSPATAPIPLCLQPQRQKVKAHCVVGYGEALCPIGRIGGQKSPAQQAGQQLGCKQAVMIFGFFREIQWC